MFVTCMNVRETNSSQNISITTSLPPQKLMMSIQDLYNTDWSLKEGGGTRYSQGLKLIFGVVEVEVVIVMGFLIGVPELEFDEVLILADVPAFPWTTGSVDGIGFPNLVWSFTTYRGGLVGSSECLHRDEAKYN